MAIGCVCSRNENIGVCCFLAAHSIDLDAYKGSVIMEIIRNGVVLRTGVLSLYSIVDVTTSHLRKNRTF